MASGAVAPDHHGGVEKQKKGQAEGRNRRVLSDIGNLVNVPAVEKKPQNQISRPVTRNFRAQLLAAEERNKKLGGEVAVNRVVASKYGGALAKEAPQKKEHNQPKPETVIVISPDEEERLLSAKKSTLGSSRKVIDISPETVIVLSPDEEVKSEEEMTLTAKKPTLGSSRKVKTLSSILTARSKAACGLTNYNKPRDPVVNIDAADIDNELAVVEYVEDIYEFYKLAEDETRVYDYMKLQEPEISTKMRSILVDWLMEVHRKFKLMPETLYLTINIVDRYLSVNTVARNELQLVGISSMLIACKYEEIWAPEVNDFIAVSANAYVREQVLVMEKAILGKLEWYLTVPTPYVFLVRFIKASVPSDSETEHMVFFLAELGMIHYQTIILYRTSMIAASAVYAARFTLSKYPLWTETLKHHTGYCEDQLRDCAKLLVSYHSDCTESKLKAAYRKFSSPEKGAVALFPAAKSLLAAS